MENYLEDYKKYNKVLFKFLGYEKGEVDYKYFTPEDSILGSEILRWIMHKINHNPKKGKMMRIITSVKAEETEIFIQEWYDVTKADGFINIVNSKEVCGLKKENSDAFLYKEAVLGTYHKALYNACVDFIIKTS